MNSCAASATIENISERSRAVRSLPADPGHAHTGPALVRSASTAALELARRPSVHPAIAEVLYPGLQSHAGHAIASRQMQGGFGAMLSIRVRDGEAPRDRYGGRSDAVEARDLAWRRRKSDRAPRLGGGAGQPLPAGFAAALRRNRGAGRPLRRSRPGLRQ
jgi:hypothetical protein